MDAATSTAPLHRFTILGVEHRVYRATPDAPAQPAGSCWHCGQGIAYTVICRNLDSGEVVTVGTTCAERVGLDGKELKAMLAERYAAERYERAQASAAARRKAREDEEAELAGRIGPHGTESRYLHGCRCGACLEAAPHGTLDRFYREHCICGLCLDAVHAEGGDGLELVHRRVLIDLATGEASGGRLVETQYGQSWVVDTPGGTVWVTSRPKRRTTQTKKGYVEAQEPWLVRRSRRTGEFYPLVRVGEACLDRYDEPIVRPAVTAAR